MAPWELPGARSMRDRGPRGISRSRVTGRASSSDGAASAAGLPATHAPFDAARAGSALCLSGGEDLCDEVQRTADPAPASPGMPPRRGYGSERRARARSRTTPSSCRRAASLLGLPLQCAYRTPRPGISTRGPRGASHRSHPRVGPRASIDSSILTRTEQARHPESRRKSWALRGCGGQRGGAIGHDAGREGTGIRSGAALGR